MEKNKLISASSSALPSPENFSTTSSKSSFAISSNSEHLGPAFYKKYNRSKSLSNIAPSDGYSQRDIRRIKERLLRTNSHLEPSAIKNFSRSQKMTLASLALVDFMSFCSMSIMAPFFPREAAEKGLSDTVSGFVFSFYALVMFITSPIFGKILPKVGAKFLFLFGMFMAGACNLLFGMLEYIEDYTLFTTFCIVIRGFEALGASAFSTASFVFVVNSFPNNIGSVIGILETFVGLGMSTGPALGGLLYSTVGWFQFAIFCTGNSNDFSSSFKRVATSCSRRLQCIKQNYFNNETDKGASSSDNWFSGSDSFQYLGVFGSNFRTTFKTVQFNS